MDGLAQIVSNVVSHFKFQSFIGFGIGAGANVLLRYAVRFSENLFSPINTFQLNYPKKLDA